MSDLIQKLPRVVEWFDSGTEAPFPDWLLRERKALLEEGLIKFTFHDIDRGCDCYVLTMEHFGLSDREIERYDEETFFAEDWWTFCLDGATRLEGEEVPTHWKPIQPPQAPDGEG